MSIKSSWTQRAVLFLTGQMVTLFGSAIVQFAISWHITLTTKSGAMLTLATLCGFLPQVLISLFAGVWADRFDRKKMIIFADALIAVFTAVLAILFTVGYTEIWLLFVISAIRSLGAGVQTPAVSAFLPELVPQEHLMRVNGLFAGIQGIMMLLSPAAAGGLYGAIGISSVFWIDVVTAFIGISLLLLLKTAPRQMPEHEPEHFFRDMLGGIRYVTGTKWLRQFLGFYLLLMLMIGPLVFLTPLMVARSFTSDVWPLMERIFGEESWRLVVHETIFALGTTAGGLLAGILGVKFRNKVLMVIIFCAAMSALTLALGFSPNLWVYLVIMALLGVTLPFVNTGSMTVLQTRVRPDLMGRVFGLVSIIGSGAMPLSMLLFGPLADVMSIEHQLIITGALMIAVSLFSLLFKEMRNAGEPTSEGNEEQRPEELEG